MSKQSKIKNQKSKILLVVFALVNSAAASDAWHLPGWQARAVVEITKPVADAGVDTAAVKVYCQGRGKPDGSDYRVLDSSGKPVPFQLTFHDAAHYSQISFRATKPKPGQQFFVYFGNPKADRAAGQVVAPTKPGAGPPKGAWIPRSGFVLSTLQRPKPEDLQIADNPKTVEDLEKLIAGSKAKCGARYQRRVSDAINPFGPSDFYISIYRGWIKIPKAGTYKFCTASNEASFSFLDGKTLIHWPGRHTSARGLRGEMNVTVKLTAGLHYLEYYHEEVMLKQVAFLGWAPPGSRKDYYYPIPESIYTVPHAANVVRYEGTKGPLLYFEPKIVDSIWPEDRHEGQYTRASFRVGNPGVLPKGTTFRWDFGDGQALTGNQVEHVYLSMRNYDVKLTATGPTGAATLAWPLEVYELQHVTGEIKQGRPPDYAKIAAAYDPNKLDAVNLKEQTHLLSESGMPKRALQLGKLFVERFADQHPKMLPRMRRLMALTALKIGSEGIDEAIANFQASITDETPAAESIDSIAQLILLLGIERNQPEKADPLLKQVEETARKSRVDDKVRAAYRRAVNATGDVKLWHAKRNEARDLYKRVEVIRGKFVPEQVRAAQVGAYPNSIREYLVMGNYGAALAVVDLWEDRFATDKVKGETFFWRGNILSRRNQHKKAVRYLARSVGLAVGAAFETEARWLLAGSLEKMGRVKEANVELAKLVDTGIKDAFTETARQKLKKKAGQNKK